MARSDALENFARDIRKKIDEFDDADFKEYVRVMLLAVPDQHIERTCLRACNCGAYSSLEFRHLYATKEHFVLCPGCGRASVFTDTRRKAFNAWNESRLLNYEPDQD